MTNILNSFDNWFVGIGSYQGEEKYPLAFVTQKTDDPSFKKREETVRQWAENQSYHKNKKPAVYKEFTNDATEGFRIIDYESRYTTSNKVFRVCDPRGWQIEIYADNLVHLIGTCTLEKGLIKAPLIYAKKDNNIYITHPDDVRLHDQRQQKSIASKDLQVGDLIMHQKSRCLYIGEVDLTLFVSETIHHHQHTDWRTQEKRTTTTGKITRGNIPDEIYNTLVDPKGPGGVVFMARYVKARMFLTEDSDSPFLHQIDTKRVNLISRENPVDLSNSMSWFASYSDGSRQYYSLVKLSKDVDLANASQKDVMAIAFHRGIDYKYLYHDRECIAVAFVKD